MLRQRPWLLILLCAVLGGRAAAQPFGQPLSAEQVACEERQLEDTVNWQDLLRDTAWNDGSAPASAGAASGH